MSKTIIIAEAGVNHNGSIEFAKKLIDAAVESGADYIKFQTFKTELLVGHSAKKADYQIAATGEDGMNDNQFDMLKKLELSFHHFKELKNYATQRKIGFLSTPFDHESLQELSVLKMDFIKISSGDLTNGPLIEKVAELKTPVILSTGMATLIEVEASVQLLLNKGLKVSDIIVLQCNTEYPTPIEDVNLRVMKIFKEKFGTGVGFSDHTIGNHCAFAAVAMGAEVIEKHITLDNRMSGPDHRASANPAQFKDLVDGIRIIEEAMGSEIKEPSASEAKNMVAARRSICLRNDVQKGSKISGEDLIMKRPGDGISPMLYHEIIGKTAKFNLPAGHLLQIEDISN